MLQAVTSDFGSISLPTLAIQLPREERKTYKQKDISFYKGEWENYFNYIAERLDSQSCIRDFIEGEAYVKTFILAYLGLTHYYIARPEYESNKGFADIFLQPRLLQLPDMVYSYCIEVKYAKRDASNSEIEKLLSDAKTQLKQYAAGEWIHHDKGNTELKSIALVFQGWKLVRVEEA